MEVGEYPDVRRAFVPVGCMHCDDPPCMHVCPSTATKKRADGIVTIDYDLCIGCAYCAVACPYQARYKSDEDTLRPDVATKCTFCVERIDAGLAKGLKPGVDPEATPACVNSCIAQALHFGDVEDAASNISRCSPRTSTSACTRSSAPGPRFYYLWDKAPMSFGPKAWIQQHWDARAGAQLHARRHGCGPAGRGGARLPGQPRAGAARARPHRRRGWARCGSRSARSCARSTCSSIRSPPG